MAKKKTTTPEAKDTKSVLARLDDGTIQLTITIPFDFVQKIRELVIKKLVEDLEIPGFRKGKAPTDVALKHIDKQRIYGATLQNVLPEYYSKAVIEHNLRPILSPRFELINVEEDRDWEIRAVTCETPNINLGDYKKVLQDKKASSSIWVPGKSETGNKEKEPSPEEKEQAVIKVLLEEAKVKVPQPLIEEEVNHRLSQLLDQVQKLGLTVEQYLASTGKTVEQLKVEYALQSQESTKLILALNKVAEEEKIKIEDKEVEAVIEATNNAVSDKSNGRQNPRFTEDQKRMVRSVLLRRKAMEQLLLL